MRHRSKHWLDYFWYRIIPVFIICKVKTIKPLKRCHVASRCIFKKQKKNKNVKIRITFSIRINANDGHDCDLNNVFFVKVLENLHL